MFVLANYDRKILNLIVLLEKRPHLLKEIFE